MKKIALIRPGIHPLDIDFATALSNKGYDVDLIAPKNGLVLHIPKEKIKFKIILINSFNLPNFFDLPITPSLYELLGKNNYDIIQSNEDYQPMTIISAYFANKFKKKFILIEEKYIYSRHLINSFIFKILDLLKITKYSISIADHVVAHGSGCLEYLKKRGLSSNVELISSSINPNNFPKKIAYDIKPPFKLLTVSRLISHKGLDVLFNALSLVNINYNLTIVGDGKLKNSLVELAKKLNIYKKINIIEFSKRNEINELMKKNDLYICSSRIEVAAISLLEAMSVGMPVISTDIGSTKDFVIKNVNGYIFQSENFRDLADKIEWICHKEKLIKFGKNSAKIAREKFDINKNINDYIKLIES